MQGRDGEVVLRLRGHAAGVAQDAHHLWVGHRVVASVRFQRKSAAQNLWVSGTLSSTDNDSLSATGYHNKTHTVQGRG